MMKIILKSVLLYIYCALPAIAGDGPHDYRVEYEGVRFELNLTIDDIKESIWDGESALPLTADAAITAAKVGLKKIYGKENMRVSSVELTAMSALSEHYYYAVTFGSPDKKHMPLFFAGAYVPLKVFVRMDGTVIGPEKVGINKK